MYSGYTVATVTMVCISFAGLGLQASSDLVLFTLGSRDARLGIAGAAAFAEDGPHVMVLSYYLSGCSFSPLSMTVESGQSVDLRIYILSSPGSPPAEPCCIDHCRGKRL